MKKSALILVAIVAIVSVLGSCGSKYSIHTTQGTLKSATAPKHSHDGWMSYEDKKGRTRWIRESDVKSYEEND